MPNALIPGVAPKFRGVVMTPQQDSQLRTLAAQRRVNVSVIVREAVDAYLSRHLATA